MVSQKTLNTTIVRSSADAKGVANEERKRKGVVARSAPVGGGHRRQRRTGRVFMYGMGVMQVHDVFGDLSQFFAV